MSAPRLISGLSEIAAGHDALICDVWGVLHDGHRVFPAAAEALTRFREERGPVMLLTNAPRVPAEVAAQCASYGVPDGSPRSSNEKSSPRMYSSSGLAQPDWLAL